MQAYTRSMILMRKNTAIVALVVLLSGAAFSQSRPSHYGWKDRASEKFALSNRAKRRLPLAMLPIEGSDNALINVQLTAQFPINLSVQDARGDSVGSCRYTEDRVGGKLLNSMG